MDILEKIYFKEPQYDDIYYDFILELTVEQGAAMGTIGESVDQVGFKTSKFFNTRYEIYMFALIIGLKKNYRISFTKGIQKFRNIGNWGEKKLINYIILCTIGKMNTDLFKIENMSEEDVLSFTNEVKITMEEYANGGFDIIKSKVDEIGINYFKENQMSLINLLED